MAEGKLDMQKSAIATLGILMLSASAAMAGECSMETLKGHYTYWSQGTDEAGKAFAEVGHEHFDGKGNILNASAVSGTAEVTEEKGTYTVNDDCTGKASYGSGSTYNIFVAPTGDSFVFSSADKGVVNAGENTRVSAD